MNDMQPSIPLPFANVKGRVERGRKPDPNSADKTVEVHFTNTIFKLPSGDEAIKIEEKTYESQIGKIFSANLLLEQEHIAVAWNKRIEDYEITVPCETEVSDLKERLDITDRGTGTVYEFQRDAFGVQYYVVYTNTDGSGSPLTRNEFIQAVERVMAPYDKDWAKKLVNTLPEPFTKEQPIRDIAEEQCRAKDAASQSVSSFDSAIQMQNASNAASTRFQNEANYLQHNGADSPHTDTPPKSLPKQTMSRTGIESLIQISPRLNITTDGICSMIADHHSDKNPLLYRGKNEIIPPNPMSSPLRFQVDAVYGTGSANKSVAAALTSDTALKNSLPSRVLGQLGEAVSNGSIIYVDRVGEGLVCKATGIKPHSQETPLRR